MSYSKDVKEEIIRKNCFKKEALAMSQGIVLSAGSLIISDGQLGFVVSNELKSVILFLKDNLENLFGEELKCNITQVVKSFKQKERFELTVEGEQNKTILRKLGILSDREDCVEIFEDCRREFMNQKSQMTAFLCGVFLGSGSVSVPCETAEKRRYGYHFEITFGSKNQAELCSEILSNFDIFAKLIERNEQYVVYLKDSELICDVLGMFGASKAVLNVLNDKVTRDMNSSANRQMNCYLANVDKSVNAAVRQIKAIEVIRSTIGIENLPDTLAEVALSRLANPEGSLSELLPTLEKKISKGALAQRFNKIIKLAEELGEDNAE